MGEKIKKVLKTLIKYTIIFIIVLNIVSYFKALDLNKENYEKNKQFIFIRIYQLLGHLLKFLCDMGIRSNDMDYCCKEKTHSRYSDKTLVHIISIHGAKKFNGCCHKNQSDTQ